ncbi:hypothetical protein B484DRAFT_400481 [Ochromonadaceae sp. CCMP2298]|nr:hypothetical protein B484DRAFT_400481 [Ochromonadaceae sp. CCMP2298]
MPVPMLSLLGYASSAASASSSTSAVIADPAASAPSAATAGLILKTSSMVTLMPTDMEADPGERVGLAELWPHVASRGL